MQQGISVEDVWVRVMAREQQGTTYLNEEFRFPHCRIDNIKNPILIFGIAKAGVIDTFSGSTAKILILLLSPTENPNVHIQMIGYLARFARDNTILRQIMRSDSPEDAIKKMKLWDS